MDKFKITEKTTQKVQRIFNRFSLKEKIRIVTGKLTLKELWFIYRRKRLYNTVPWCAGGVKRLGIPKLKFSDGPRGIVMHDSTCFPVAIARAASFDRDLENAIAQIIGIEARAGGANFFGGVCINLLRHPAWGRAQESYGEDPFLQGEMGLALTRGVQTHNVIACIKHFALNSMENMRFEVDVKVDDRALYEVYLPHFKKCIDGGASSVMGAYNKVNGDYACENKRLLRDILMEEWGFEGFVISDFLWAIHDSAKAAKAGCHVEMPLPRKYGKKLKKIVKQGAVPMEVLNDAVTRTISTLIQFSNQPDPRRYSKKDIACQSHMELARHAAEKSMVLLKNKDNILPIPASAGKILVVGKLADTENTGDHGSSRVYPPYVVTPLQGIKNLVGKETDIIYNDGTNLEQAKRLAQECDYVIAVCGYQFDDEGEFIRPRKSKRLNEMLEMNSGGDRRNLSLHDEDIKLLKTVGVVNKHTVAVIIAGSAVIMEEWKDDVSSILMSFYSGSEGGKALANILFGKVNPSGKIPFTIAKKAEDYPFFDIDAKEITYDLFHGYSYFDKNNCEPAFAFGFGLSYTQFEYRDVKVEEHEDFLGVRVQVKNIGKQAGSEVVQVYIGAKDSLIERQKKLLAGFEKYEIGIDEEITAKIKVDKHQLKYYDTERKDWVLENCMYTIYAGSSSRDEDLLSCQCSISFNKTGDQCD